MSEPLLPPHGGYRKLRSFQAAELAYDGTLIFCDRFIEKRSRTHDQMVQAARSGVQNIAEASVASGTSKKTELKLTNVARASLEELMLDVQDFLRQRGLRQWDKDSPEALAVRKKFSSDQSNKSDLSDFRTATPEVAANTLLCLINQASYLLHRQLQRLEKDFLEKGGFTERLYAARSQHRSDKSDSSDQSDTPTCPRCQKPMRRRTARQGPHTGQPFWGCTGYPECRGTRPITSSDKSDPSDRPTRRRPLTPDERAQLMKNFCGYDIAPDMVRLARVNLYLHGFPNPTIHEYDTLTSEERWDERYDVIMANPPFMTPKGGIRPHNRFSIKANRSEVLFADYIAEHLNPGGRAGIIVPEGIIFQSQNAYKALRKMLIENYLWAVVSLPAGVFNPYSGVKTSILFLDRNLARRADSVLFVKIENDGFDLGPQRRPIPANDLPAALSALREWQSAPRPTSPKGPTRPTAPTAPPHAHAVPRQRLLAAPDLSLSGDRYRPVAARPTGKWPMVKLREIARVGAGDGAPQDERVFSEGTVPFFRTSDVGEVHLSPDLRTARDWLNEKAVKELRLTIWPPKTILFPKSGASTFLNHRVMLGCQGCVSSHLATIVVDSAKAVPEFVYHLICQVDARTLTANQNYPSLRLGEIEGIELPLPPLAEQERLVAEVGGLPADHRRRPPNPRPLQTHPPPQPKLAAQTTRGNRFARIRPHRNRQRNRRCETHSYYGHNR